MGEMARGTKQRKVLWKPFTNKSLNTLISWMDVILTNTERKRAMIGGSLSFLRRLVVINVSLGKKEGREGEEEEEFFSSRTLCQVNAG